jgi:hypothetical protein
MSAFSKFRKRYFRATARAGHVTDTTRVRAGSPVVFFSKFV